MEKYGNIPGLDKPVSRIVYGCAGMKMLRGEPADTQLDAAFAAGINAFDTARVYGGSEKVLGDWIKSRGNREKLVLISKGAHPVFTPKEDGTAETTRRLSREEIRKDIDATLLALGVDELDVYLLHRDDLSVPVGEIAEWMDELVKEGKTRTVGGSNWTFRRIAAQRAYAVQHGLSLFTVSSPHFSLARQDYDIFGDHCVTLTGELAAEARDWYRHNPVALLAYGALSQGFFSGKWHGGDYHKREALMDEKALLAYGSGENFSRLQRTELLAFRKGCTPSQLALKWLFTRGMNLFAAVSSENPARIQANWDALDIELSQKEADGLCKE